ncbi:MAG: hypothetical protein EBZ50_14770, partial [Alphaproteobacteria bacterium]|nr:hypothetical protein [Alphaproteobacteria bacterium]
MAENIKVFELAKELNIKALDLIDKIRPLDLKIKNHMADLTPEQVARIKDFLNPPTASEAPKKRVVARKNPAAAEEPKKPATTVLSRPAAVKTAAAAPVAAAGGASTTVVRRRSGAPGSDQAPNALDDLVQAAPAAPEPEPTPVEPEAPKGLVIIEEPPEALSVAETLAAAAAEAEAAEAPREEPTPTPAPETAAPESTASAAATPAAPPAAPRRGPRYSVIRVVSAETSRARPLIVEDAGPDTTLHKKAVKEAQTA